MDLDVGGAAMPPDILAATRLRARNNRIRQAWSWREAKPMLLHPLFHRGYLDYLAGRPFDYRTLDDWSPLDQIRYENGREIAAECRARGITIRWSDRTRIPRGLKAVVTDRAWARRGIDMPASPQAATIRIESTATG